jgi:hypothetical protein
LVARYTAKPARAEKRPNMRSIEQNEIAENEQFVIILDSGKSMLPDGTAIPYFTGDSPEETR